MATHIEIINKWPKLSDFADDLGVQYGTAKAMRRRGSIPSEHWVTLISKAQERGLKGVTLEALATVVAKQARSKARQIEAAQ